MHSPRCSMFVGEERMVRQVWWQHYTCCNVMDQDFSLSFSSPWFSAAAQTGLTAKVGHVGAPTAEERGTWPTKRVGDTATVLEQRVSHGWDRQKAQLTEDTGSGWLLFCNKLEELLLLWALEWRLRRGEFTLLVYTMGKIVDCFC